MNRRQFFTSTAIALPSVTLLGAISTQPTKTYRSANSLYSNEELHSLCEKYGMYFATSDVVVKPGEYETDVCYTHTKTGFNIDESLINIRNEMRKYNENDKIVIYDILTSNKLDLQFLDYCVYIHYFIISKEYREYETTKS